MVGVFAGGSTFSAAVSLSVLTVFSLLGIQILFRKEDNLPWLLANIMLKGKKITLPFICEVFTSHQ